MTHLKINIQRVVIQEVHETGIYEKDLLIPRELPSFRGTMKVHQAVWHASKKNALSLRKLSCAIDNCATSSVICAHEQHIGTYCVQQEIDSHDVHDGDAFIPPEDTFWTEFPTPVTVVEFNNIQRSGPIK